ncbi:MAG: hypothetical protein IPL22_04980 [Bacteroidetes bacterium]|nr:hypothetical protein [Bacteroidota bacterium]
MLKNIFRLTILLQFPAIALVVITPVISVNKLLYPTRIDSAFVNMQQLQFQKMKEATQKRHFSNISLLSFATTNQFYGTGISHARQY